MNILICYFKLWTAAMLGFILLASGIKLHAQYGNVWAFGDKAGVDFNTNPPTPVTTRINTNEGSASFCNGNGQLLFYTDGTSVWDRNNVLMPNGTDLPGLGVNITNSTTQGALIAPMPGDTLKYYIFSLGAYESGTYTGRLYYSVVDMSLNNGLGDVSQKGILLDTGLTEHQMAVSGKDCNIWLLVVSRSNVFKAYDIGLNGIAPPVISPRVAGGGTWNGILGSIDISPDGNKLAIAQGNLVLYDFDADLGTMTNPFILDRVSSINYYGVCFSPDNSKLYGSTSGFLWQYDLSLTDTNAMLASKTPLGVLAFPALKRGPDGKIYCANNGKSSLNVIKQPDSAGLACQYTPEGFSLSPGTRSILGLPNSTTIVTSRTFTRSQTDTFYCKKQIVLTAIDTSGINYIWDDGSTGPSRIINRSGTYWVRYEMSSLCKVDEYVDTFHIVHMENFIPGDVRILTNDTTVCEGYVLRIAATGSDNYTYRWTPSDGVSDTTALEPEITVLRPEVYTLRASYLDCADTLVTISIGMERNPRIELSKDTGVCQGVEVALEPRISPYRNDYSYEWSPSDGLNKPDRPNTHFTADSTAIYTLKVTTPTGCASANSIRVVVYPGGFGSAIPDTGVCPGSAVALWAEGGIHYHWTPSYGLSDSSIAAPLASPSTPTRYTVYITDLHNCVDTEWVFVNIYPEAILEMPDSVTIYPGEQYLIEPGTNCHYFQWFPPSGLNSTEIAHPIASPEVRTRYFVTAATEQGCLLRDSIDILVEGTIIDMPNAFTPAGGAHTFKPAKRGIVQLKSFNIYNRWGKQIFSTTDIEEGWDGTYKGTPQPLGVYVYTIEAETDSGKIFVKKGNVTLVR